MKEDTDHIKRIIEGVLFAANEPLSIQKIRDILSLSYQLTPDEVVEAMESMRQDYMNQNRGFRLDQAGDGFLLRTSADIHPFLEMMKNHSKPDRLSHAAAEVLAIIAYRQPITRPQIDEIRGVDSSGSIYTLLERQLIEPLGKLEVPGRPTLYGVTKQFLHQFALRDVSDLPKI